MHGAQLTAYSFPIFALIGFAGVPFTLAAYAVEERGSRNDLLCKRMM